MSFQDPGTDAHLDQDIAVPIPRKPGSTRRYIASFAAAAVGTAAIGGGIWAWRSFMAQGDQPAQALPANTLAYAALDLDPPGGQKVAAYNALKQFPSIKRELGLNSADDVRKSVVEQVTSGNGCHLSYASVKSWLGDRMAIAVVPQKQPEGVVVLQLADADAARTALSKAGTDCHFGYSVKGAWAVLARNTSVATQVSTDAAKGTLNDHQDYKRLTGAAGDPGLVTLYAAPEAGPALLDAIDKDPLNGIGVLEMVNATMDPVTSFITAFGLLGSVHSYSAEATSSDIGSSDPVAHLTPAQKKRMAQIDAKYAHYESLSPAEQKALDQESEQFYKQLFASNGGKISSGDPGTGLTVTPDGPDGPDTYPTPQVSSAVRDSLKKFTGLGGVGRISDGAAEVEIVGDQLGGTSAAMYAGSKGKELVANAPKDTAVAFGAGLAQGWVDVLFDQVSTSFMGSSSKADSIKAFEKATGLDVPGDLEALGGDGVSILASPGVSFDDLYMTPSKEPVAARITGDATKIDAALDKLRTHLGSDGSKLLSRHIGSDVVISMNAAYLSELAKSGGLGDTDTFHKVVPDADGATSVFFINFNAGDWLVKSVSGSDRADAEPLSGLGMSVTKKDGQQHIVFRLSFDN